MINGYVHAEESFATLDGYGIRYAIFLSGCNLKCIYCHNPDTQMQKGRQVDAQEILTKVLRYRNYFVGGGGVTISGGEPLLQSKFLIELILLLKKNDIHTVIDTSGSINTPSTELAMSLADMIIMDLKFTTEEDYKKYTGGSLSTVISNLEYLDSIKMPIWIRTVVVPGINEQMADIAEYRKIIDRYKSIFKFELLPFHTLGFQKYKQMKMPNLLENTLPMDLKVLEKLKKFEFEKSF